MQHTPRDKNIGASTLNNAGYATKDAIRALTTRVKFVDLARGALSSRIEEILPAIDNILGGKQTISDYTSDYRNYVFACEPVLAITFLTAKDGKSLDEMTATAIKACRTAFNHQVSTNIVTYRCATDPYTKQNPLHGIEYSTESTISKLRDYVKGIPAESRKKGLEIYQAVLNSPTASNVDKKMLLVNIVSTLRNGTFPVLNPTQQEVYNRVVENSGQAGI